MKCQCVSCDLPISESDNFWQHGYCEVCWARVQQEDKDDKVSS